MKYEKIHKAKFLSRPNRFIALVEFDGEIHTVHVKNTGRCRELLVEGATVYLNEPSGRARKTRFDLVSVEKERKGNAPLLINMDSQAPNEAAAEWLLGSGISPDGSTLRREVTVGASRFDFSITDRFGKITYVEVKGVTLERDGKVMFPDAPTERGVKHLSELAELSLSGVQTAVLFVIQMKGVSSFSPNDITHPSFGDALRYAEKCGTRIIAMDCLVSSESMIIDAPVDVIL